MLSATDKKWNSATTLYIARRLEEVASGRRIKVLDMGCGEGAVLDHLLDMKLDLYGYDFQHRRDALWTKYKDGVLGDFDDHIRIVDDERSIPFESDYFDVVYANQVFEHVKFIDRMFEESARVLKPDGVLLITLPLATYPVEAHLRIPFVHWIPPGGLRVQYLRLFYATRLARKKKGITALQTAIDSDRYLYERTYYRFINEIEAIAGYWFESKGVETSQFIQAKADLSKSKGGIVGRSIGRILDQPGKVTEFIVTHLLNAAFCFKFPKVNP